MGHEIIYALREAAVPWGMTFRNSYITFTDVPVFSSKSFIMETFSSRKLTFYRTRQNPRTVGLKLRSSAAS